MENKITTSAERRVELLAEMQSVKDSLSQKERDMLDLSLQYDHETPYFKIKHFVGDAQVTPYAKYKQFLLELRSREEVIENLLMNVARQEATIEVIKEDIQTLSSPAQIKVKEFDLITNQNDLVKIKRRVSQAYTERASFLEAIAEMYESGEAYTPDGIDFKEVLFNPELNAKYEAEHWRYRLGKQAALDIISTGKIGSGNMDAITMMGQEDAAEAIAIALNWSTRVSTAMEIMQNDVVKSLEGRQFTLDILDNKPLELE